MNTYLARKIQNEQIARKTGFVKPMKKKPIKSQAKMDNAEVENIMENFMNRLFNSPTLLEDEKLNFKIEKIFENKLFQKMVEHANVLEEAGLASTDEADRSDEQFDPNKSILDKNNIEKCELIAPYVPPAEQEAKEDATKKNKKKEVFLKKNKKTSDKKQQDSLSNIDVIQKIEDESEKFEQHVKRANGDVSDIKQSGPDSLQDPDESEFIQQSSSIVELIDNPEELEDKYENDEDPGFDLYEVKEEEVEKVAKHLAQEFNFPANAMKPGKKSKKRKENRMTEEEVAKQAEKKNGYIFLPENLKHPANDDSFYPVGFDKTVYDCFSLKVIYDRERTGFEETKEFPIVIGTVIAGRYQIKEYLGSAAFSKAVQCRDLRTDMNYCMKIIENNKDYFDQSIDEIKLLRFINCNGNVDEHFVLKIYDFFYYKEHLFIVTELLKDNLYEYYKFNRQQEDEIYFTVGRLQKIAYQILKGLEYIHGLKLIHCDLKPENIMIKSYSRSEVKIIDFGSSCYIHDHLSSYVQSRSYRAPEVIIGCKYDYRIDMWSLGCILAELFTGNVLFQNDTVQALLARVIGILGPFPEWMMQEGKLVHKFFTEDKILYQDVYTEEEDPAAAQDNSDASRRGQRTGRVQLLIPKKSGLSFRLKSEDLYFLDFVRSLLQIDPLRRPTASEALKHPWFTQASYPDGLGH